MLIAASSLPLLLPIDDEKRFLSIVCGIAAVLSALALPLAGVPPKMTCGAVMLSLFVYLVARIHSRFMRECRGKLKTPKLLRATVDARSLCICMVLFCGCLYLVLLPEIPEWIIDIPVVVFALLLSFRVLRGRILHIRSRRRSRISVIMGLSGRNELYKRIFDKAVDCMERKKPYTDSRLRIEDLAKMIGVSRTDLSRAINLNTNGNYSQFVNSFRVPDAERLMTQYPDMKVTEAGRLSGFQSESAFTSVFKRYIGDTPSVFMRHLRYKRKQKG